MLQHKRSRDRPRSKENVRDRLSSHRQATGETDEGEYRREDVAAQTLCSCKEQCRLRETVGERATDGRERSRGSAGTNERIAFASTLEPNKPLTTTRFWPKFSIIPAAPLKIYIHFYVHHTIFRRCNGITAASSWSVTVTPLQTHTRGR